MKLNKLLLIFINIYLQSMMSDFEKLAERIKAHNPVNPIFKDRNKDTQLKFE